MKSPLWGLCHIVILSVILGVNQTNGVAVMSVDFGSEWMKVAIVSPGVPMEIALNKESKRKTPAFIAFRNDERTFGEDAQNVAVRFPSNGYGYLLDLLGKNINNPIVKLYKERFPYYNIEEDPERGTVVFRHDKSTTFTPEELIGMLLHKAKEFAEESAGQTITDAVFVVPGYFNQAERRAFINAANLGGLKVLQLINDYSAGIVDFILFHAGETKMSLPQHKDTVNVALNYGIFRAKDFNETTQYILFYDMGASSTTAAIVAYQTVKQKDRGVVETHPQATIIGVGYDRTLGGLEMQLRLQKHLARKFTEVKKTKNSVYDNPRAMAKLFKEAGRVKNVLSANVDHFAQVEGLLDEEDFKVQVTREELETLCKDLFERVRNPIDQAIKTGGISLDIINHVILVGAGTRVPKVQEILSEVVKKELGKNINTDEAAVMGAVYKAADISTGFKVKKFISKDGVLFPIQVTFQKANDGSELVTFVQRTLFSTMNPYPQKKILTFNRHLRDFDFNVHYGDLGHLPANEIEAIGTLNLSLVHVNGVKEVLKKHEGKNVESKGIKAHFAMDESGLLQLLNVDYVAEKTVTEEEEEESTLQKLGSSFSKLFGGSDPPAEKPEPSSENKEDGSAPASEEKAEEEKENADRPKEEEKKKSQSDKVEKESQKNTTEKVDKKPKIIIIKENISATFEELSVPSLNKNQLESSFKKIEALDDFDNQKQKKEQSRNALESYVFDALLKLDLENYVNAATAEEKESIVKACQEVSNWLDEEFDAQSDTYDEKLTQIKTLTGPLYRRVKEHEERPEALAALRSMINGSEQFLLTIRTKTKEALEGGDEVIFTPVEMDTLEKVIKETTEWQNSMEKEQSKLPLSAAPKLTIKLVTEKMAALDREVKYLVNKAKLWKPKKVEKKSANQTREDVPGGNKTANATGEASSKIDSPDEKKDDVEKPVEKENSAKEAPSEKPVHEEVDIKNEKKELNHEEL